MVNKFFGIISKPRQNQGGYILPVILALGIALSGLGTFTLGVTSNISSDANNQIYKQLATEVSRSGLAVAQSCLSKNANTLWSGDLLPNEDCQGTAVSGRSQYVLNDTAKNLNSSYAVSYSPVTDGKSTLTSVGTVSRNGKVQSTDSLRLVVSASLAAPTFGSISPASGTTGTITTITGSNFVLGSTSVAVGGVAASTSFVSETQLRITIPSMGAGGYKDVVVTTPSGSATGTNAFYYYAAPTFSGISPARGTNGTVATITGTNFDASGTSVTVDGVSASTSVSSTTSLTVVIPSIGTSGAKNVVITTPGGSATGVGVFYYYFPPTFSSISKSEGITGTSAVIYGSNFVAASTSVTVDGAVASLTFNDSNTLTISIPGIGSEGWKDVVVSTPGGSATGYSVFYYWFTRAPSFAYYTYGANTYYKPAWANYFDIITLGGGGGGQAGGAIGVNGKGGFPGRWAGGRFYKASVAGAISVYVGGYGTYGQAPWGGCGSAGGSSYVSGYVSSSGGAGGCQIGGNCIGYGPGTYYFNGVGYGGGGNAGCNDPPIQGNSPGGGGGGGRGNLIGGGYGGWGSYGGVWIRAYQAY